MQSKEPAQLDSSEAENEARAAADAAGADRDQAMPTLPESVQIIDDYLGSRVGMRAEQRDVLSRFAGHLRRLIAAENAIMGQPAPAKASDVD